MPDRSRRWRVFRIVARYFEACSQSDLITWFPISSPAFFFLICLCPSFGFGLSSVLFLFPSRWAHQGQIEAP